MRIPNTHQHYISQITIVTIINISVLRAGISEACREIEIITYGSPPMMLVCLRSSIPEMHPSLYDLHGITPDRIHIRCLQTLYGHCTRTKTTFPGSPPKKG